MPFFLLPLNIREVEVFSSSISLLPPLHFTRRIQQDSHSPTKSLLVVRVDLARLLQLGDELGDALGIILGVEVDDEGVDHFCGWVWGLFWKLGILLERCCCSSGGLIRLEVKLLEGAVCLTAVTPPWGFFDLRHCCLIDRISCDKPLSRFLGVHTLVYLLICFNGNPTESAVTWTT